MENLELSVSLLVLTWNPSYCWIKSLFLVLKVPGTETTSPAGNGGGVAGVLTTSCLLSRSACIAILTAFSLSTSIQDPETLSSFKNLPGGQRS